MRVSGIFRKAALAVCAVTLMSLSGCMDEGEEPYDPYKQLEADIKTIDDYLSNQGITDVIKDPRGVRMVINGTLGTGPTALVTNRVKVAYTGYVLGNDTPFENNKVASGAPLSNYIGGWQIAMTTLPAGTSATVYIPSPYAYANRAMGSIPANSILRFEITFQAIERTETEKTKFTADSVAINNYLDGQEGIVTDESGVRYRITQEGSGGTPVHFSKLKAKIEYRLMSNASTVAYTQELDPTQNELNRVADLVNGLKIVLPKLNKNGKATIYVPSGLGFGTTAVTNQGTTVIPANSNLVINVELFDFL